jgi:hypothetical protein
MSFLTTKSLPRRTVLRGLGATVALPFLEAMLPAFALRGRAATTPVHRFQTFYVPNGMAMEYWTPKGEGSGFELSPIFEPLAPYRIDAVLSGLRANWNYIHAAPWPFLTGRRGGRNEVEIIADVSMDQLLARRFAKDTQVASLELAMDAPANAAPAPAISAAPIPTISWRATSRCRWNATRGGVRAVRRQRQHRAGGARGPAPAAQGILDSVRTSWRT